MSEWEEISFDQLYKIPSKNGLNRPSSERGEGYKMINMGELFGNDRIADIEMERVKLTDQEMRNFEVKEGDLLFARQSIVAEGAGKCSIVKKAIEYLCFESHIIRIRLDDKKASSMFYYYLFQSQLGKSHLSTIRLQGVQAGIRGSDLGKLKILFLNLEKQQRIATILSTYDDLIEYNNRRITLLEQIAVQVYKEWFVRMRFPGYENAVFEKGVPKTWEAKKMKELCNFKYGTMPKSNLVKDIGYPIFSGYGITGFYDKYMFKEKTLIVVARGVGGTGDVKLTPPKCWLTNLAIAILPDNSKSNIYFLLYYLSNIGLRLLDSGSAQSQITINDLGNFKILLPPFDLQEKFQKHILAIFEMADNLKQQTQILKQTRDLLLPRLISGKLRVKLAENEII
jgi:type I restriction enzyme S subunit